MSANQINFTLTEKFDTITCPYCGIEFLAFVIFRYEYDNVENADLMGVMTPDYCPGCGKSLLD